MSEQSSLILPFVLYFIVLGCSAIQSDLYCSSEHLKIALKTGKAIVNELSSLDITNRRMNIRLARLRRELDSFIALEGGLPDGMTRHPIYVLRMVRQLYTMRSYKVLQLDRFYGELPSRDDYDGTLTALLRLQYTYRLDVKDMAKGIIAGEPSIHLSPTEILDIADYAFNHRMYGLAAEWFSEAWENDIFPLVQRTDILRKKALCEFQIGSVQNARRTTELVEKYDKIVAKRLNITWKQGHPGRGIPPRNTFDENYKRLCRGEVEISHTGAKALSCHVTDQNRNPLLVIQPVHLEELRVESPNITLIRNIVTEREAMKLKAIAKKQNCRRATILKSGHNIEFDGGIKKTRWKREFLEPCCLGNSDKRFCMEGIVVERAVVEREYCISTNYCICKRAFLKEFDNPMVKTIRHRIAAATGLNRNAFEVLQVANYGIGGWYSPHPDYLPRQDGDYSEDQRLATVLIYAGGATVFPFIGERLVPSMGDAAFWFNVYRNGTVNRKTIHAACPVLLGTKWISNQWIRRNKNEFNAPCVLEEDG